MPAFKLKLASTFVLALVEEKLSPYEFLVLFYRIFLKIWRSKAKLPKKCLHLTVELFNLAKARDFPESASVFQ